jgi:hypothetical protein
MKNLSQHITESFINESSDNGIIKDIINTEDYKNNGFYVDVHQLQSLGFIQKNDGFELDKQFKLGSKKRFSIRFEPVNKNTSFEQKLSFIGMVAIGVSSKSEEFNDCRTPWENNRVNAFDTIELLKTCKFE